MAKESGLGITTLSVDNGAGVLKDIKNDVTDFEFSTPRETQEVTGVDKFAVERLLLLGDFSITLKGVFNDATDKSHDVLKSVCSADQVRTVSLSISGQTLAPECLLTDYKMSRSDKGELTWEAPFALADGAAPTWA